MRGISDHETILANVFQRAPDAELHQEHLESRSSTILRDKVVLASQALSVVVADTPDLVAEACRLRYQVYCVERGFEPGDHGKESDDFDGCARHVLVTDRASGEAIGTVRVIPPPPSGSNRGFPMKRVCPPGALRHLPVHSTGEISRFAVSKQGIMSCRTTAMVRLGLMQGIVRLSQELHLTHWCAIMEPSLLRLLRMTAIYFSPMGPLVEHHGIRQPSYGNVHTVLERLRREQPDIWDYVTLNGELWYERLSERLVA
jgi:N-acyl-L-homoserine lactone synthetase